MTTTTEMDGAELMRRFLPQSPFVVDTGIELTDLGDGWAQLRLGFRDELTTIGTVVHGGAIATLIDTAAMTAAWSGAQPPDTIRGSTVGLSVTYLAPADGASITATAEALRRGRRLTNLRVDVHTDDGTHVAAAIVTYQIG